MRPRYFAFLAIILSVASGAGARILAAQAPDAITTRLAALGARGDTAAVRRLADSVLAAGASPSQQAEALYQRGMIAGPSGPGRADLLRLVIDHPAASRTGDALYALAQSDLAAGDQATGIARLTRMVRDHAGGAHGPDAAVRLGQLLMADGDLAGGCAALDSALAYLPTENVERRNQVNYTRRPCERLAAEAVAAETPPLADTTASRVTSAAAESTTTARPPAARPPAARGTTARPPARSTPRPAPAPERRWSAQVAAYTNRADAERAAERLKARGMDVRVTSERPYRVRIGRYTNRSEAVALVGRLKAEGTNAILVEAERR